MTNGTNIFTLKDVINNQEYLKKHSATDIACPTCAPDEHDAVYLDYFFKPSLLFYRKSTRDGFYLECRQCRTISFYKNNNHDINNPNKVYTPEQYEMLICPKCRKDTAELTEEFNGKPGEYYWAECKECDVAYRAFYKKAYDTYTYDVWYYDKKECDKRNKAIIEKERQALEKERREDKKKQQKETLVSLIIAIILILELGFIFMGANKPL